MARTTWLGVIASVLVANLVLSGFVLLRTYRLASQGAQAHAAECQYKRDLQARVTASEDFFHLTHKQLVAKYGLKLADDLESVPRATLVQSLRSERAAARSLRSLSCTSS